MKSFSCSFSGIKIIIANISAGAKAAPESKLETMFLPITSIFCLASLPLSSKGLLLNVSNVTVTRTAVEQAAIDLEFSKDIASVLTEATLESNCDGIVIVTSGGCTDFMDYMLLQLSQWAPPVLIVSYQEFAKIGNSDVWATYLAWKRRPCSIIFVCDLIKSQDGVMYTSPEEDMLTSLDSDEPDEMDIGHLNLPKFIESSDQVLFLSNMIEEPSSETLNSTSLSSNRVDVQTKILQRSGILLQIVVENRTETESLMHIYSVCEYCGQPTKWQERDLGYWQRNKTQFAKFFHVFHDYHKLSFNDTTLSIGFFNHPPHFNCYTEGISAFEGVGIENITTVSMSTLELLSLCGGVEWEMISQMRKSLEFSVTWTNLSNSDPSGHGYFGGTSNISNMIAFFEAEKIDLAVGGISITPKRTMYVDFSSVFTNDPIVFVVEKKSDLFALGIWLAFNPEIWPLILLLIGIISLLFHIIINQYTLEPPFSKKLQGKWSLSRILERQYLEETRKPIHVAMFEALQITLQPLLGQPLSSTQITLRPRRLLKLLLTIWWFSCLIISTLYNTSLITSLINPISPKEAESLQNLLDFGYSFKSIGKQGAFFELIKSAMDDFEPEEEGFIEEEEPVTANDAEMKAVKLIKQISRRLITDGSKPPTSLVAYVIEESAVKGIKWDQKEIGFSQIKVIRERLFLTTYAWPVQQYAPFKHKIDTALGRLNSAGLIKYWYEEFGHKEKEQRGGKFRLRQKLSQINLNMKVLQGAFIFLIFGHALGAAVLGIEHLTKRYVFRVFTKQELKAFSAYIFVRLRKVYAKYFASEHMDIQLRRQKNRMRFRVAVRTVTSFKQKDNNIPYMK